MTSGEHKRGSARIAQLTAELKEANGWRDKLADKVTEVERERDEARRDLTSETKRCESLLAALKERTAERDEARAALEKISAIRDSIVGTQKINWSEHIYPLVAVLKEAGFKGAGYEISRANMGTVIEQRDKAEAERDAVTAVVKRIGGVVIDAGDVDVPSDDVGLPAAVKMIVGQRASARAEAAAMRGVLEEMAADDNVAMSHRIYARMKLDAGMDAGRDLAERVKRLEAVVDAARAWAEKFHSDVYEAVAVRKALAELDALAELASDSQ